ncbi:hypothetical protein GEMRC1_003869 [Eukaryota sp. GEM-RC1]
MPPSIPPLPLHDTLRPTTSSIFGSLSTRRDRSFGLLNHAIKSSSARVARSKCSKVCANSPSDTEQDSSSFFITETNNTSSSSIPQSSIREYACSFGPTDLISTSTIPIPSDTPPPSSFPRARRVMRKRSLACRSKQDRSLGWINESCYQYPDMLPILNEMSSRFHLSEKDVTIKLPVLPELSHLSKIPSGLFDSPKHRKKSLDHLKSKNSELLATELKTRSIKQKLKQENLHWLLHNVKLKSWSCGGFKHLERHSSRVDEKVFKTNLAWSPTWQKICQLLNHCQRKSLDVNRHLCDVIEEVKCSIASDSDIAPERIF